MDKLKGIIKYILKEYPHKGELSNARVTKLVYLSDWHQAIQCRKQISSIDWYFDNFGPYVTDIQNKALEYPDIFEIEETCNMYGKMKRVLKLLNDDGETSLDDAELGSIDYIIGQTSSLNWNEFIKLVYSTYPIISSDKYSSLNLVKKAGKYARQADDLIN